jgi:hypothetical protein
MGGKKLIGAEPSRGNCRSRRGRHDSRQPHDKLLFSEATEFSLFSSVWILGTATPDLTIPQEKDIVLIASEVNERNLIRCDDDKEQLSLSSKVDLIMKKMRDLEAHAKTQEDALEALRIR